MFCKLINGELVTAERRFIRFGGKIFANPTDEQFLSAGYKPLVVDDYPADGEFYSAVFTDEGECIRKSWAAEVQLDNETSLSC